MRIAPAVAAALTLLLMASCQVAPPRPGNIEHVVLVWLKQPGDAAIKAQLVATARTFPGLIPGILSLTIGDALASDREIVDDSFDLALVVRFVDAQALAGYETHPVHVAAVQDVLAANAARIVVYDAVLR